MMTTLPTWAAVLVGLLLIGSVALNVALLVPGWRAAPYDAGTQLAPAMEPGAFRREFIAAMDDNMHLTEPVVARTPEEHAAKARGRAARQAIAGLAENEPGTPKHTAYLNRLKALGLDPQHPA